MPKKSILTLTLLMMGMWVLGCVPAFYGTARIEPDFHGDIGLAIDLLSEGVNPVGLRGDFAVYYGFGRYIQLDGHLGAGFGFGGVAEGVVANAGVGLQLAAPIGPVTPAFRAGFSYWGGDSDGFAFLSPCLLLGFGRKEFLTLGGRLHYNIKYPDGPLHDVFGVVHIPNSPVSIFSGVGWDGLLVPHITLGVGYKIK